MHDLTILFQGRYSHGVLKFATDVRKNFPHISIIVSCWEDDRVNVPAELFELVEIVFSKDPGAIKVPGHKLDNLSRQLVSTQAGLGLVRSEYVLKLRSDMSVDVGKILKLQELCVEVPASDTRIFRRKMLVTSLTTLDSHRSGHYFHVCDWMYFGLTLDVADLFKSAELPDASHFRYFESRPDLELSSRYRPEAYIVYSLVRKKRLCNEYAFSGQESVSLCEISAGVLRDNFVVLNPWSLGLRSEKHKNLHLWMAVDRYTEKNCGTFLRSLPFLERQVYKGLDLGARVMTRGAVRGAKIKRILKGSL